MLTQEIRTTLREIRGDIKNLAERQREIKKLLKTQKDNKTLDVPSLDSERFNNKSKITALLIILTTIREKTPSHNTSDNTNFFIRKYKEYYKLNIL